MTKADMVRENLRLAFRLAETDADELAAGEPVLLIVNPRKPHKPAIIDARELLAELGRLLEATDGAGGGFPNATTGTQDHTRTGACFSGMTLL